MTRKDYILIAQVIHDEILLSEELGMDASQANRIGRELCGKFERDNSRFNGDKFLKACGIWTPKHETTIPPRQRS